LIIKVSIPNNIGFCYNNIQTYILILKKVIFLVNTIQIAVRTLVEHVYSSGSIDSRFRSQSTLLDGTRIHQKIQGTYQDSDQKEVYLRADLPYKDLVFTIDGRCDGLLCCDGAVIIDEIKSTSQPLEHLGQEGLPVHWAQAKMYAYIYASVTGDFCTAHLCAG
jgi:DNA excision repair protein ERCC-2